MSSATTTSTVPKMDTADTLPKPSNKPSLDDRRAFLRRAANVLTTATEQNDLDQVKKALNTLNLLCFSELLTDDIVDLGLVHYLIQHTLQSTDRDVRSTASMVLGAVIMSRAKRHGSIDDEIQAALPKLLTTSSRLARNNIGHALIWAHGLCTLPKELHPEHLQQEARNSNNNNKNKRERNTTPIVKFSLSSNAIAAVNTNLETIFQYVSDLDLLLDASLVCKKWFDQANDTLVQRLHPLAKTTTTTATSPIMTSEDDTKNDRWILWRRYAVERVRLDARINAPESFYDFPNELEGWQTDMKKALLDASTNDDDDDNNNRQLLASLLRNTYSLETTVDMNANNEPVDLIYKTRIYSPTLPANAIELVFYYHHDKKYSYTERWYNLRVSMRSLNDVSGEFAFEQTLPDDEEDKWTAVFWAEYDNRPHKEMRGLCSAPQALDRLIRHLGLMKQTTTTATTATNNNSDSNDDKSNNNTDEEDQPQFAMSRIDFVLFLLAAGGVDRAKMEFPEELKINWVWRELKKKFGGGRFQKELAEEDVQSNKSWYDQDAGDSDEDEDGEDIKSELGVQPQCRQM